MTKAQLRAQTAKFAGDPDQTRYSTQYDDALNRAQEQFALETRALWEDEPYTTSSGTAAYNLPADFMWEDWITYDGAEMVPISRHEIQRIYGSDWASQEGTPTHVIVDPEEGRKTFTLVPIPQEAKSVVMRYYPLPAELTSDSQVPLNASSLMAQFHMGIAAFAGWLLLMGEESTASVVKKQDGLMAVWNDATDKAINLFKNTASAGLKVRGNRFSGVEWS